MSKQTMLVRAAGRPHDHVVTTSLSVPGISDSSGTSEAPRMPKWLFEYILIERLGRGYATHSLAARNPISSQAMKRVLGARAAGAGLVCKSMGQAIPAKSLPSSPMRVQIAGGHHESRLALLYSGLVAGGSDC